MKYDQDIEKWLLEVLGDEFIEMMARFAARADAKGYGTRLEILSALGIFLFLKYRFHLDILEATIKAGGDLQKGAEALMGGPIPPEIKEDSANKIRRATAMLELRKETPFGA